MVVVDTCGLHVPSSHHRAQGIIQALLIIHPSQKTPQKLHNRTADPLVNCDGIILHNLDYIYIRWYSQNKEHCLIMLVTVQESGGSRQWHAEGCGGGAGGPGAGTLSDRSRCRPLLVVIRTITVGKGSRPSAPAAPVYPPGCFCGRGATRPCLLQL